MKKFFIITMLSLVATLGFSQISPEKVVEDFWTNYETKSASETLDELYKGSPWVERAKDDIENLKSQFENLPNIIGEYYGNELLTKNTLAGCYMIYVYMVKYDRQPMRIQFEFYKADKEWALHGFTYDFELTNDFEKLTKQKSLE